MDRTSRNNSFFFLVSFGIFMTLVPLNVHSKTLGSDIHVLRSFKQAIDPVSISATSFLYTWDFSFDPCEDTGSHFLGILCTIPFDNSNSQITMIDLEGDGYGGLLTAGIGNLTELTSLNLSKNKFRAPIPNSITKLKKLRNLELSDNFFSGSIPPKLSTLKRLNIVNLSANRLTGSLPSGFSSLRRLTHLSLSNNQLSGRIPDLSGLWQLRTLDLSNNLFEGNLPKFPHNLASLLLDNNDLCGHISQIRRLQNLETLDVSNNILSGLILSQILALPMLNHANFSKNNFTKMSSFNMTNSTETRLQVLDAHTNQLHGLLPMELATYSSLTTLDLGQNLFTGSIPRIYGEKVGRNWRNLFLDHNFLEGDLPEQLKNSPWKIKGSLASNCLKCPRGVRLCHGGQKAASKCAGQNQGG